MVTTIIAVYGAAVATMSTLLGLWYFLHTGPRFQAEASVYPPHDVHDAFDDDEDAWSIALKVWNTGRADFTVNVSSIVVHRDKVSSLLLIDEDSWEGPDVPVRIAGNSGESWWIRNPSIGFMARDSSTPAKLSVALEVGGKREIDIPVWSGWKKQRFVLDFASPPPVYKKLADGVEERVESDPSS
jgi:hypothetical protein